MDCKLCGSSNLETINIENNYFYCNNCELIFIDPEGIIDEDEEKERYENHDNNHQNDGYVKMFKEFINKLIEPHINLSNINNVLEFGCGPGPVLADLLKERGLNVDLYDPYFFPEKVFEDKKYDLITSTEVFEHFSDPVKEIKLLKSHLKNDSYLAVMTSFHPGPEEFRDWWYRRDPTHVVFFNERTFKEIASIFNLEIVYTDQEKYILFRV